MNGGRIHREWMEGSVKDERIAERWTEIGLRMLEDRLNMD